MKPKPETGAPAEEAKTPGSKTRNKRSFSKKRPTGDQAVPKAGAGFTWSERPTPYGTQDVNTRPDAVTGIMPHQLNGFVSTFVGLKVSETDDDRPSWLAPLNDSALLAYAAKLRFGVTGRRVYEAEDVADYIVNVGNRNLLALNILAWDEYWWRNGRTTSVYDAPTWFNLNTNDFSDAVRIAQEHMNLQNTFPLPGRINGYIEELARGIQLQKGVCFPQFALEPLGIMAQNQAVTWWTVQDLIDYFAEIEFDQNVLQLAADVARVGGRTAKLNPGLRTGPTAPDVLSNLIHRGGAGDQMMLVHFNEESLSGESGAFNIYSNFQAVRGTDDGAEATDQSQVLVNSYWDREGQDWLILPADPTLTFDGAAAWNFMHDVSEVVNLLTPTIRTDRKSVV